MSHDRAALEAVTRNPDLLVRRGQKVLAERRLIDFMELYWPILHPGKGPMRRGWAIEAICDHLEGVHHGHIKNLLIDVPPGFSKSMSTNVFFPAWEWGPRNRGDLSYLSAAYSDSLTQRDNEHTMTLLASREYQENWGDRFQKDKNTWGKTKFINSRRGFKEATSVKGVATGGRADRLVCDDPHNVLQSESDAIRSETLRWFLEAWPTRTKDEMSAFIVIMQRVHESDVAAACIELGYTHLTIPMMFEWDHPHRWFGGGFIAHEPVRKVVEQIEEAAAADGTPLTRAESFQRFIDADTLSIRETVTTVVDDVPVTREEIRETTPDEIIAQMGWTSDSDSCQTSYAPQYGSGDPRGNGLTEQTPDARDGELAFPELFPKRRVREMQRKMTKDDPLYAWAGQMQQRPSPRGGGHIKDEHIRYVDGNQVPTGGTQIECGYDLAGSTGRQSPYTVKVKGKYGPDGLLYILEAVRDRVEADALDEFILGQMGSDEKIHGKRVEHYLPQDPGQAGKYQKKAMSRRFRGYWFKFSTEVKDKETRAKPVIAQFGAGNVRLVRGPWNKQYVSDMKKFPAGKYKDFMDATSRMDMGLTEARGKKRLRLTAQVVRVDRGGIPGPYGD